MSAAMDAVGVAMRRGSPARRDVSRAIATGALAQVASIALVGGAGALLVWASSKPGLGAIAGLLVAVELVAFLRAPLRHAERLDAHDLGLSGLRGWRTWLLDGVATWTPSRLGAARAGDLLSRCLEDADRLQDLWVRILVPAGAAVASLVVASVLLALADVVAGLAVLVATLVVGAAAWASSSKIAALGVAEAAARGAIAARVVEFAHGAQALALLEADGDHRAATTVLIHRADALAARRGALVSSLGVLAAAAGAVAFVAAAASVDLPTRNPALAAGVVLATLACLEPLAGIAASLERLGDVAGAAERLDELAMPVASGGLAAVRGDLAVDHVDVASAADEPVLLADVVLCARLGERVAVVGPSGTGKSSLLAVAAGLEPARAGRVLVAGTPLEELDEASLRSALGWLPSHPSLLEGRVRDVLDVGRGLDDETLSAALRAVGLDAVIAARGGLDAVIGQRGTDLSGGERRRLAIARLLAGHPSVLVLDEPTAGLDNDAAASVLAAVATTGAAVLVASHDERVARWASSVRTVGTGRLDDEFSR